MVIFIRKLSQWNLFLYANRKSMRGKQCGWIPTFMCMCAMNSDAYWYAPWFLLGFYLAYKIIVTISAQYKNRKISPFFQDASRLLLIEVRRSAGHGEAAASSAQDFPGRLKGGARVTTAECLLSADGGELQLVLQQRWSEASLLSASCLLWTRHKYRLGRSET